MYKTSLYTLVNSNI